MRENFENISESEARTMVLYIKEHRFQKSTRFFPVSAEEVKYIQLKLTLKMSFATGNGRAKRGSEENRGGKKLCVRIYSSGKEGRAVLLNRNH